MRRKTFLRIFAIALSSLTALSADEPSMDWQECVEGVQNLSARLRPCSRDFESFADLIVWTAREAGTDCWAEVLTSANNISSNDLRTVHFSWDPGFRVGIGYGMDHDQWDTKGYYTWFQTRGKDQVSSGFGTVHSAFLGNFYVDNQAGKGLSGPAYSQASIQWKIRYNIFDWELGRNFWVSESLTLRPFLGAKGGWIHQSIQTKWQNPDLTSFPGSRFYNTGRENLKNHFWGIGPQAGINTKWNLISTCNQFFNLFGDLSGALMFGHWNFGDVFQNDIQQKVTIVSRHFNNGATMIRTFMGLGWDICFCQWRFSTKLGYEAQFWLNQLQFYSFTAGRLDNELTLQGGTLEFSFDF